MKKNGLFTKCTSLTCDGRDIGGREEGHPKIHFSAFQQPEGKEFIVDLVYAEIGCDKILFQ